MRSSLHNHSLFSGLWQGRDEHEWQQCKSWGGKHSIPTRSTILELYVPLTVAESVPVIQLFRIALVS